MMCLDCQRGLEPGATACVCGWQVPPKAAPKMPERTYSSRMPAPRMPRELTPFEQECRSAYLQSQAYRAIKDGKPLRNTVAAALPREPGDDDDMVAV